MKYWVKVEVECESQDVIGVPCYHRAIVEVLHEAKPGWAGPELSGPELIARINLKGHESWSWTMETHPEDSDDCPVPYFFCFSHQEECIAALRKPKE